MHQLGVECPHETHAMWAEQYLGRLAHAQASMKAYRPICSRPPNTLRHFHSRCTRHLLFGCLNTWGYLLGSVLQKRSNCGCRDTDCPTSHCLGGSLPRSAGNHRSRGLCLAERDASQQLLQGLQPRFPQNQLIANVISVTLILPLLNKDSALVLQTQGTAVLESKSDLRLIR